VSVEQLFAQVYPGLQRYCVRMAGDRDMGEDLAQEAFVRLLDRRVEGRPPQLRAWLYKVATHLMRERARVGANRRRLLEENPVPPGRGDTPEEELDRQERIRRVRAALAGLAERDRTLLLLREEGFSYEELAGVLEVKAASIGTLLARARRRLAAALEQGDDE
jgi:RNA polymerase sigma factor (sigma-70 family)